MRFAFAIPLMFLFSGPPLFAQETPKNCSDPKNGPSICITQEAFAQETCAALQIFSDRYAINPHFFTRLIWQESRFNPNAVSPANAQGIAQFIPSTAKIRGLKDPFNPAEALDESARYLKRVIDKFGNEGLAAIAYNAGELRVNPYVAKTAGIPEETWNYVQIITGHTADKWRETPTPDTDFHLQPGKQFLSACLDLAKKRIYTKYRPSAQQFKPWGVQLAAGTSRSRARASYRRRTAKCKRLLVGVRPDYIYKRQQTGGRKRVYVARLGYNSRGSAARMCSKLKAQGCLCAVFRN